MNEIEALCVSFLDECKKRGWTIATAESCTGGLIIASLTDQPGSSVAIDCGYVTYSNKSKIEMLGVDPATIFAFGAVSEPTAREMADGALRKAQVGIALSVTGIAGPGGGSKEKPVGLVWFGVATRTGRLISERRQFANQGRDYIRHESVKTALQLGLQALRDE